MDPRGLLMVAVGLVAVVRPDIIRRTSNRAREQRLAQLDAGAEEVYFEERRALEAYKIKRLWAVRLFGAILFLLGVFGLFM